MKNSTYTVQPTINNNVHDEDQERKQIMGEDEDEEEEITSIMNRREINSLEELPYYMKFTIKALANKGVFRILLLLILCGHLHTIIVFSQMAGSLVIGISLGFLFLLGHLCDFLPLPDFSKGFFLDILLSDKALVKRLNTEIKGGIIFGVVLIGAVMMPIFVILFTYNFSLTEKLGPNTFYITWIICIVGVPSAIISNLYGGAVVMIPSMSTIWEDKVTKYLKNVRNILITSNDTKSIINELSKEQKRISIFAQKMSTGLNSFYTYQLIANISWIAIGVFFIATPGIGGNSRVGVLIAFTFLLMMCFGWLYNTLRGIGKANNVWENAIKLHLSDSKIQDAKVRLGWSEAIFNAWINNHECKGLRAFGEQITIHIVKQGFSLFASIITVGIYFAAREELKSLLS